MLIRNVWYRFILALAQVFALAFLRFRALGQHNIPVSGGAIIASNHQSYLDPGLLAIGLTRPINFMARKSLFTANWFFGWLISSINAFPIVRGRFDSSGMREAIRRLKAGRIIVVFPEGTRSSDGNLRELKSGLYFLAQQGGVPVIPAIVDGAFDVWSRHHALPVKLAAVRVIYGKPLAINQFKSPQDLTRRLYQELTLLKTRKISLTFL